jgi:hypothetical protein
MDFLSREELAKRWDVSVRTVDRLRISGRIPWVDIAGGAGRRPIVRFKIQDIAAYENRYRQFPHGSSENANQLGPAGESDV